MTYYLIKCQSRRMCDSPCNKKCQLVNSTCKGCLRTIDEIANWSLLSNSQKIKIFNRIKKQKEEFGLK